jgi:hypothetical protein
MEKINSVAFYEKAARVITEYFGELTEEDTKDLRKTVFEPNWKKEGKWFLIMRTQMYKSISEIADELNIKEAHLRKLENGNDFKQRDITAGFLENYYKLHIN